MPTMPGQFRPQGQRSKVDRARDDDRRRGSAAERGYTSAWAKASLGHRRNSPLCRYCEVGAFGPPRVIACTLVDHLYPHRGDRVLFWARQWWVSSCTDCHNGPKQVAEAKGLAALHRLAALLGLDRLG